MAETAPAATQDAALLRFLDDAFDARIALQPESQTQLGLKTNYDRLDDYTDAAAVREQALLESQLKDMHARFRPAQLGPSARLSYSVFEYDDERRRDTSRCRQLPFPVTTNAHPSADMHVVP